MRGWERHCQSAALVISDKAHVSSWFKLTERWRRWGGGSYFKERGQGGVIRLLGMMKKELQSHITSPTPTFTCKLNDWMCHLKVPQFRWREICCFCWSWAVKCSIICYSWRIFSHILSKMLSRRTVCCIWGAVTWVTGWHYIHWVYISLDSLRTFSLTNKDYIQTKEA